MREKSAVAIDPSARVDGYDVGGVIGAGGSAIVFSARATDGGAVALKIARGSTDDVRARFAREVSALRRVETPAAPTLVASGTTAAGVPWIAMEYMDGETLAARLARAGESGALAIDEVKAIVRALAGALGAVHRAGVVHRDVKPENVVLRADGTATLLDFGLCAGVGATRVELAEPMITREQARVGTVAYMAPEQIAHAEIDERADVYALGVIAFEMATGRPPFVGDDASVAVAQASARVPRPSEIRAEARGFDEALARALAKDPARRFASAREFAAAIDAAPIAGVTAPAIASHAPSASSKRPVALLALRTSAPAADVARAVARFGGDLQRTFGDRAVIAFTSAPTPAHGVHAAIAAATSRELAALAPPIAHVAEVRIRTTGGRTSIVGAAVEQPDAWPADGRVASEGVVLTEAAASFASLGVTRAVATTMHGRASTMEQAVARARDAIASGEALLVTIRGEEGAGKTRVVEAIAAALEGEVDVRRLSAERVDTRALVASLRDDASSKPRLAILDDAQAADASVLDALELATLDRAPLVVLVAATPALDARRPSWGFRANAPLAIDLAPLEDDATRAVIAELLRPVEHLPSAAVDAIAREARGHPATLVAITDALHRAGAVRVAEGGAGHYLAADQLAFALGAATSGRASSPLAGLAPGVARVAELVSVFDVSPSRALLDAAAAHLGAALDADAGVAIDRLVSSGVLRDDGAELRFVPASLRRSIAASTSASWAARTHAAAFAAMTAAGVRDAARARHALAAGDAVEAHRAFADLAREAFAEHRHAHAEEHATMALSTAPDEAARRELHALRARARVRLQRLEDALVDIAAAREVTTLAPVLADLALEESTVRDWMHDFEGSAAAADRAAEHLTTSPNPVLETRLAVARARTQWRRGANDAAAAALGAAIDRSISLGDVETAIIAGLMRGSALVYLGRLAEAGATFDATIARCEESRDDFHLAVACSNRLAYWTKLRRADEAERDLRRAVRVARELGNAQLERISSHNLAELLYLRGQMEEALPLARRSLELARRFFARFAIPNDALLLVRIFTVVGTRSGEATALLDEIDERWPRSSRSGSVATHYEMGRALERGDAGDIWDALVEAARSGGSLDDHAEVVHASVVAAARAGLTELARSRADAGIQAFSESSVWVHRLGLAAHAKAS